MRTAFGFFLLLLCLSACSGMQKVNPDPRGGLRFRGEPKNARIEIDDISLGPLHMFEKDGVLLRPGDHRVVVRAAGFFPEYQIVEIKASEIKILKIDLRPIPD